MGINWYPWEHGLTLPDWLIALLPSSPVLILLRAQFSHREEGGARRRRVALSEKIPQVRSSHEKVQTKS